MKYLNILLLLLSSVCSANAQQTYEVSAIPKELLSHASAIVRNYETTIDVKNLDDVTSHIKLVITVLNKNGDDDARINIWYNKVEYLKSFKGVIYDEWGKPLSKIAEHDLTDHSAADGYSLFVDDRFKRYRPAVTTYPYTVEYDYEVLAKQTLMFEDWNPNPYLSNNASVQHSSYKIICKPGFNIRYKEINYPGKVHIDETPALKTYSWEINNIKVQRYEPYSPVDQQLYTTVKIAPEKFVYDNISGSFSNWKEYGEFVYNKLVKDRQQLPPETIAMVKDLVKDITDPKLKAKKIYEYMQQKTRYVSVQIGIGGWRPFLASDVDQLSYGDCKALVNYTQSLLKVADVESYYVLNMAGSEKVNAIPDFASMNQFDHVILCLPFKNDTTWVDCTSKENPFGYLGDFTDDRLVVACTPKGGILLHTPKYTAIDNKQSRKARFTLSGDGMLTGEMVTRFEGTQYDNRDYLVNETFTEQVKKLKELYPVENLEITSLQLKQDKSLHPVTTETIKLNARDYVAQNGGRYFFNPNTASRYITPLKNVTNRNNPVYINRGYFDEDDITYTLPDGYRVTTKPLELTIDKPFGKYKASMLIEGNRLTYKRSLQINDGTYSKDVYTDLVDFYQTVYEADNYTLTMEKK
jgi:transglutaminase-like putative cysteine protease